MERSQWVVTFTISWGDVFKLLVEGSFLQQSLCWGSEPLGFGCSRPDSWWSILGGGSAIAVTTIGRVMHMDSSGDIASVIAIFSHFSSINLLIWLLIL